MGRSSGWVVKELVMQSRLGGGFWISSIYARINEFVPAFWLSGVWDGCGEQATGMSGRGEYIPCLRIETLRQAQGRLWGTRRFGVGFQRTGNSKVQGEIQGVSPLLKLCFY
jgi:hypothetical protein